MQFVAYCLVLAIVWLLLDYSGLFWSGVVWSGLVWCAWLAARFLNAPRLATEPHLATCLPICEICC